MYHYAGNNPVKYIDPDGREDMWGLENSIDVWGQYISRFSSNIFDRMFGFMLSSSQGNENATKQLDEMSAKMRTLMGDFCKSAIVSSMEFMSDYGSLISMCCYASGNVGLGLVVDGVTFACDITTAILDYKNSNMTKNDKTKLTTDLITTVLTTLGSGPMSKQIKKLGKLGAQEFIEKLANSLTNIICSGADSLIDSTVE